MDKNGDYTAIGLTTTYAALPTTLEWTIGSPPAFHTFEELPRLR